MHTQYHHMLVSIPCNSDDKENEKTTMALLQCTIVVLSGSADLIVVLSSV